MQTSNIPIPAIIAITGWSKPSEFKTDKEFSEYFYSLNMPTQVCMAKAQIPQAQRLLAEFYQNASQHPASAYWWIQATTNNDPIALLHTAEVLRIQEKLDGAESLLGKIPELMIDNDDQEFLDRVQQEKIQALENLASAYLMKGKSLLDQNDIPGAQKSLKKSFDLCNKPFPLVYLARSYYFQGNYTECIYWSEQVLYLSAQMDQYESRRGVRAAAHNMIGSALEQMDKSEGYHPKVLEIATHFRKAQAYQPLVQVYTDKYNSFVNSRVKDNLTRNLILMDTDSLLATQFGDVAKTFTERYDVDKLAPQAFQTWISYPPPAPSPSPPPSSTDMDTSSEASVSRIGHFGSSTRTNTPSPFSNTNSSSPSPTLQLTGDSKNPFMIIGKRESK